MIHLQSDKCDHINLIQPTHHPARVFSVKHNISSQSTPYAQYQRSMPPQALGEHVERSAVNIQTQKRESACPQSRNEHRVAQHEQTIKSASKRRSIQLYTRQKYAYIFSFSFRHICIDPPSALIHSDTYAYTHAVHSFTHPCFQARRLRKRRKPVTHATTPRKIFLRSP